MARFYVEAAYTTLVSGYAKTWSRTVEADSLAEALQRADILFRRSTRHGVAKIDMRVEPVEVTA